jgi:hypothetical protein
MKTIEQQFTSVDKYRTVIAQVWMPVIHNVSEDWANIKAKRMEACGATVRIVEAV